MNPVIEKLPVVVLYPHTRCNCRCLMCDIWKETDAQQISQAQFNAYVADFEKLSVEWVVFSGGEPLMHPDLFRFCDLLRERHIRTTILSTGLLFRRHAAPIARSVDDVIVSLDGPPAIHDRIRGVPGAFEQLAIGVQAIRKERPGFPITARSTVQRENFRFLSDTAHTAHGLGLQGISFLAADLTSTAFNRPEGWTSDRQSQIALTEEDFPDLDRAIEELIANEASSHFLLDKPDKLRRIATHYRAHLGLCRPEAPRCNAPWVSAVLETGALRPCFFHPAMGNAATEGFAAALNNPEAIRFRENLDIATNPTCARCVCSLNWSPHALRGGSRTASGNSRW